MTRNTGFTLIEPIAVVALATVLLVVGAPGLRDLIINNRIANQANEPVSASAYARSEAVKRGTNVTICGSSTGTVCDTQWNQGWVVFLDPDNVGAPANTSDILRALDRSPTGASLSGPNSLSFLGDGSADLSASVQFDLNHQGCSGMWARSVDINVQRRTAVTTAACT
jgi:type IV fimbrial biogenesis protein FimT